MNYYRDYFEDAGSEHEQEIIKELESPKKVAQTIKEGLVLKIIKISNLIMKKFIILMKEICVF